MSWQEMERRFHTQFFIVELEIRIAELSRVTQRGGESIDSNRSSDEGVMTFRSWRSYVGTPRRADLTSVN